MARISLTEETRFGPGWVRVAISPALPEVPAGIVLARRQSDKPYLGDRGWQSQRHRLTPDRVEHDDAATILLFGPQVTSHLMLDMDVDVAIEGAGIQERHFWPDIMGAQPDALGQLAGFRQAPPPTRSVQRENERQDSPPGDPPAGDDGATTDENGGRQPRSRRALYSALGVLALLVLAGAAYFLAGRDDPVAQAPAQAAPAPAEAAQTPSAPPASFAELYETYRSAGGHEDELFQLFEDARTAGENDIAERAIVLAETRGSAEAMVQLGRWKDPGQPADQFSDPQPAAAARYYRRAAEAGHAEADALLSRLCASADDPAESEILLFQNFPSGEYCPQDGQETRQ